MYLCTSEEIDKCVYTAPNNTPLYVALHHCSHCLIVAAVVAAQNTSSSKNMTWKVEVFTGKEEKIFVMQWFENN